MNHNYIVRFGVVSVALLLIGAGCNAIKTESSTNKNNIKSSQVGTLKSFTLVAKKFTFEPRTISVNKGDTVRLVITNPDVEHSFVLSEFNINVNLPPSQTKTVEFVADQVGTFNFRCWVYCGDGHSDMAGQLIVQ